MCGKTAALAPEDVLPFCSRACKLADLGRWLDGSYRIAGPPLEFDIGAWDRASASCAPNLQLENDGHEAVIRSSEDM